MSADKEGGRSCSPGGLLLSLALTLPLYALDQLTKWWIIRRYELGDEEPIIPGFFSLVYFINTGSAFGMFKDGNTFFIVLSFVALAVIVGSFVRGAIVDPLSRIGAALLAAGVLGNLTDRLIHGHVIDFLLFDLHIRFANPWPAFNVADSCICIAVGLFIIASFREQPKPAPTGA